MADEDLSKLDEFLGDVIDALAPARRKRAALRLAQKLRSTNLKRIAENVQPDGSAMQGRRPRMNMRGQTGGKSRGKMFRGLRAARNWQIDASADGFTIAPIGGLVARIAEINHFGEQATVGRLRDRRLIRHRYAQRPLLGISSDDENAILEVAADLIDLRG